MGLLFVVLMLLSYLVGSIPSGFVVTRVWSGQDIRQFGSGNIGTSNVLRTIGLVPALLVLLLDAGKGVAGVYFGSLIGGDLVRILCGIAAIAGHNWSVFLRFKGGKGIATSAGVLFALWPAIALILVGVFVAVVSFTRYISLASLGVAVVFPVLLLVFRYPWELVVSGVVLSFFAIYRHSSNIKRLLAGQEYRIGEKAKRK